MNEIILDSKTSDNLKGLMSMYNEAMNKYQIIVQTILNMNKAEEGKQYKVSQDFTKLVLVEDEKGVK